MTYRVGDATLSEKQAKALLAVVEWAENSEYLMMYSQMADYSRLSECDARVAGRALIRKKILERRSAFDENDGMLRGSGVQLTSYGRIIAAQLTAMLPKEEEVA